GSGGGCRIFQRQGRCARATRPGSGSQSGQTRHSRSQGTVHMSAPSGPLLGNGGEWILNTVKRNPEGLLLLAAGAVLMMRAGGSQSSRAASTDAAYGRT